ncbi:TPM domain-containing protein [uncultured Bifidobacterium sp.]|uniref:TPM domain-containing protein n=1 Tax=uncultured Bifidobacterium sp. TaxID=165187 RepID=UPI0028DB3C89|nr:TPM domain-containing protein [uncultured Bifidobacterium sp.]
MIWTRVGRGPASGVVDGECAEGMVRGIGPGATARMMSTILLIVALVLASGAFALVAVPSAFAASENDSGVTISDDITDTENLLGSDFSSVNDAITRTKRTTGVSVRLLYVSSFGTESSPSAWAADLLESLEPQANTVLLAVASSDGSLVVAVSSNSDSWLRSQSTVDDLSAAALRPLVKGDDPDWSGSALAMMSQISTKKATATSTRTRVVSVVAMGAVLVALVAMGVLLTVRRRRSSRHSASRRRHGGPSAGIGGLVKGMLGVLPRPRRRHGRRASSPHRPRRARRHGEALTGGSLDQDSDGVQETSRDPGQAGNHEQSD